MRVYLTDLDAQLHDIRGLRDALPAIYALMTTVRLRP